MFLFYFIMFRSGSHSPNEQINTRKLFKKKSLQQRRWTSRIKYDRHCTKIKQEFPLGVHCPSNPTFTFIRRSIFSLNFTNWIPIDVDLL